MRAQIREEAARRNAFGNIRPLITTVHQGHRFIAVGSRLYFDKRWRTFTDFLLFYVQDVMGRDWFQAEAAKPEPDRHPLIEWQCHITEISKTLPREPDGLISAEPDGIMSAYLLLAYDLYVLRDHGKLQDEVVRRLRHRDQFQGARYELFVAATFIRAGLEFAYEDETDGSRKHPEFVARHSSGLTMAVEAKARQRMRKHPFDLAEIRPPVKDLLASAVAKQPAHSLVVFVEVNLPPEHAKRPPSWIPHVNHVVQEMAAERGGTSPFGAVFFTNRPHLYGQPDEPDPSKHFYAVWPDGSAVKEEIIDILGTAATQYGNVPSKFPNDFGATSSD